MSTETATPAKVYDPTLRVITRAGQYLLTFTVVLFVAMGVIWPDPYANVWQLILAHVVGGRPGNVLLGVNLNFHPLFIFFQCALQDFIILFLFYPVLVVGYRHTVERRVLGSALASIRQAATKHKSKVEPYGTAGLMVFVIFPFWSTGALVGAFVGYLIGMRTKVTFGSVIAGNIVAVALWVWLFDKLDEVSSHLTTGLLIAIFATVLVGAVVAQVQHLVRARIRLGRGENGPAQNEKN